MDIKECVLNIVNKYNYQDVVLTKESNLFLDVGIDSLSFIELIIDVEKFFKIEIKIEEIGECHKIDNLIKLVKTKLKVAE